MKSIRNPTFLGFHVKSSLPWIGLYILVWSYENSKTSFESFLFGKNRKKWLILYFSRMSKIRENRFFGQKLFNFRIIVSYLSSFRWVIFLMSHSNGKIGYKEKSGMTIFVAFYFRWLQSSLTDIEKVALIISSFNHLKWKPSYFRMMVNDVVKDRDRLYRLIVGQLQVRWQIIFSADNLQSNSH